MTKRKIKDYLLGLNESVVTINYCELLRIKLGVLNSLVIDFNSVQALVGFPNFVGVKRKLYSYRDTDYVPVCVLYVYEFEEKKVSQYIEFTRFGCDEVYFVDLSEVFVLINETQKELNLLGGFSDV